MALAGDFGNRSVRRPELDRPGIVLREDRPAELFDFGEHALPLLDGDAALVWSEPMLFGGADEAVDAVIAKLAFERSQSHQVMQVGERLAQGKGHLVPVERPPEQHRQQIDRTVRPPAGGKDLVAARPVVVGQRFDPGVQSVKRQIMRR
jgi:hypothetical protein